MRSMKCGIIAAAAMLAVSLPAFSQVKWGVEKTLQVGGEGGWDYMTVDSASHRLFVPRVTHTMVLDENTGKVLGDIPGQKRAHGVAIVPALNRGFITDGGGQGAIVIFDLKTYAVLGTLKTVPDSDGIRYDMKINRVLAVAGDSSALMVIDPSIDPKSGHIDAPIQLGGAPEYFASNGAGKVFVNLEDKNMVAVVDLNAKKVVARWPVAPGAHPVGMAMDVANNRLFIGTRNPQKLIVMDANNGKVLDALPIGKVNDAVGFDAGQAFASCFDGTLTVAGEQNGKYAVEQVVHTAEGARTLGIDHETHTIYLPTSDFLPVKPGVAANARPQMKPGTFKIIVVGRQ